MAFFKRRKRQQTTGNDPQLEAVKLRGGSQQAVAGESHYQEALSTICGGWTYDGHHHGCLAVLIPEPGNEHDPHAVAIHIEGMKVGYLPREDAPEFGPVLRQLAGNGQLPICDAEIRGGWDRGDGDRGHFGVVLFLAPPQHCHPDSSPPPTVRPTQHHAHPSTGASSSSRLEAGIVRGRHYTDWVETVKDLKRLGHNEQARDLLLELCSAAEKESAATASLIPPWYFEQAAIVYRKLKDYDGEVAVLERYVASPLAVENALEERLKKARAKAMKTTPDPDPPDPDPPRGPQYAPGWYDDPWGDTTLLRYYDGSQWTGHVHPK